MNCLKSDFIYVLAVYSTFAVDILIIFFVMGTNKIGYAGVDQTFRAIDYLKGFYYITTGRLGLYLRWSLYGSVFLILPMWIGEYLSLIHIFKII